MNINPFYSGTNNPNNKYSEEDIHKVCTYLSTRKDLSMNQIARLTKVSHHVVREVKRRAIWKFISCNYKF